MYWRVRKVSPEQILRTYGVHAGLALSLVLNLFLFSKVAATKGLSGEQKGNFDAFTRQVINHLYDATYLSYENSMRSLAGSGTKSELGDDLIRKMKAGGQMAKDSQELKTIARQLRETKCVSATIIQDIKVNEPDGRGLVPIDVKVRVIKQSAEGPDGPFDFNARLFLGIRGQTNDPVVADFVESAGGPEAEPQP